MRAAGSLLESLQRQSAPKTIDYGALHSELHKAGWQSASEVGPGKPVIPRRLDLLTATGGVSEFGKLLSGFQ